MLGDRAPDTPATSLRVCRPGGPEGDGSPQGSHQKSLNHPPFRTARLSQAEGWGREAPAGGPLAGTMARTGKETSGAGADGHFGTAQPVTELY